MPIGHVAFKTKRERHCSSISNGSAILLELLGHGATSSPSYETSPQVHTAESMENMVGPVPTEMGIPICSMSTRSTHATFRDTGKGRALKKQLFHQVLTCLKHGLWMEMSLHRCSKNGHRNRFLFLSPPKQYCHVLWSGVIDSHHLDPRFGYLF